jgi:hypothetical protein
MPVALLLTALFSGGTGYALGPRPAKQGDRLEPGGAAARAPLPADDQPGGGADDARAPSLSPPSTPGEKQRGVALGLFAEDVSFSYGPLLAELVALGATHVSLIVPIYQTDVRSSDIALHTRFSPTLALVADTIRLARRYGLQVTLFPILRLRAAQPGEWRGTLAPSDPDAWFLHYGDLVGDLAAVANLTGATRFVVGSELSSLDGDLERWQPLIERFRGVYKGTLVYSANWDHFRQAKLLDLVDEDGVTGYFNLRADARADGDEPALEAAWRKVEGELAAWHAGRRQPLVLTEVGYRSRAGSTAAPWDEGSGGAVDLEEQRRAFEAFRHVWRASSLLDGIYVWNWYGFGGPTSTAYTPRGKPAEAEVKQLLEQL